MKIRQSFNPDKLFFTSDDHFYHENIIKFRSRPFYNAAEMNEVLINNWNDAIYPDYDVIVAGDFIHSGNLKFIGDILCRLNGKIWLARGNHDVQNKIDRQVVMDSFVGGVYDTLSITVNDDDFVDNACKIFISHYPHLYWPRDNWHVHGHVHSGPLSKSSEVAPFHPLRFDVGVDNNLYKPVSYRDLKEIFFKQIELNDARKTIS